jgi:hypothetical protein
MLFYSMHLWTSYALTLDERMSSQAAQLNSHQSCFATTLVAIQNISKQVCDVPERLATRAASWQRPSAARACAGLLPSRTHLPVHA